MKRISSNGSKPVSEQAAEWYVELDEPPHDDDVRQRFLAWLKQSPQHIQEFLAIAELERAVAGQSSSIVELVAEVEAATGRQAVAFLGEPAPDSAPAKHRVVKRRWPLVAWASAAGVAALVLLFVAGMPSVDSPVVSHRTELGEQRSIALGDGSIVTLNTLSEVIVRFDDSRRRVALLAGEAMFEVVPDAERPFIVESGRLSVQVVGTKFSVYRRGESTQVAVVEGLVTATANPESAERVELRGGQGAVFDGDGELHRDATFDLERAVAWTERRLIFENARLADVVSEFNRYNRMQLRVDDSGLADTPVTTVVNAHDVGALVAFLELQPEVRIEYGVDTIRISTATDAR
jgi:transmembrane sensor